MPSNGLSARRSTLKRPAVCKSPRQKDCGACVLSGDFPPDQCKPGETIDLNVQFLCDMQPPAEEAALTMIGGFTPNPPTNTIPVNQGITWLATAPTAEGQYIITITAVIGLRCKWRTQIPITVKA